MGYAMSQSPASNPVDTSPPALTGEGESATREDEKVVVEIGGRGGLDPTRYGDWEKNGRCIDF